MKSYIYSKVRQTKKKNTSVANDSDVLKCNIHVCRIKCMQCSLQVIWRHKSIARYNKCIPTT